MGVACNRGLLLPKLSEAARWFKRYVRCFREQQIILLSISSQLSLKNNTTNPETWTDISKNTDSSNNILVTPIQLPIVSMNIDQEEEARRRYTTTERKEERRRCSLG